VAYRPVAGKDLHTYNEIRAVAMQRDRKHFSKTIELMVETVFSTRSVQRGYLEDNSGDQFSTCVEAGSNTSTVALRVVGGDEKGTQCVGV
jgi:hypothetical protein